MRHDVGMICVMEAFFAAPDEGERLEANDRSYRLLGELPDLEVVDAVFEPGWEGVDAHVHDDHTDSFYVLEGEVEFLVNGKWRRGGPGSFFSAPPGVEHGFRIAGEHPNPRAQRSRAERSLRRRNAIALKTEARRLGI